MRFATPRCPAHRIQKLLSVWVARSPLPRRSLVKLRLRVRTLACDLATHPETAGEVLRAASGTVFVGETQTPGMTRHVGWREGWGSVATALQSVNPSCSFSQRDTSRICENGHVPWEIHALWPGSGLTSAARVIDTGAGSGVDVPGVSLERAKGTLGHPVWNSSWGWGEESGRNYFFGKGQQQADVWTPEERMDVLSMRTVLRGRD